MTEETFPSIANGKNDAFFWQNDGDNISQNKTVQYSQTKHSSITYWFIHKIKLVNSDLKKMALWIQEKKIVLREENITDDWGIFLTFSVFQF